MYAKEHGRRIVILDDEEQVLRFTAHSLAGPGIEIMACLELEAAQTMLENFHVDTLVTDLNVSELGGLEALSLVRHTKTHFPHVDIVVVSGSGGPETSSLALRLGARIMLSKPVSQAELRRNVLGEEAAARTGGAGEIIFTELLESVLTGPGIVSRVQPILRVESQTQQPKPYAVECLARGPAGSPLQNPQLLFSYANKKQALFAADLACIQAALRELRGIGPDILVFLNVQPRSLSHPDFSSRLQSAIAQSDVDIDSIVLELTEQHSILNPVAFRRTIDALRGLGLRIAMDDYGEGMANLKLLHELRPDFLKLSGHFCQNIENDVWRRNIVQSTFDLVEELKIPLIVEQIETQSQLDVLTEYGKFYAQGYLFSRPQPFEALGTFDLKKRA